MTEPSHTEISDIVHLTGKVSCYVEQPTPFKDYFKSRGASHAAKDIDGIIKECGLLASKHSLPAPETLEECRGALFQMLEMISPVWHKPKSEYTPLQRLYDEQLTRLYFLHYRLRQCHDHESSEALSDTVAQISSITRKFVVDIFGENILKFDNDDRDEIYFVAFGDEEDVKRLPLLTLPFRTLWITVRPDEPLHRRRQLVDAFKQTSGAPGSTVLVREYDTEYGECHDYDEELTHWERLHPFWRIGDHSRRIEELA